MLEPVTRSNSLAIPITCTISSREARSSLVRVTFSCLCADLHLDLHSLCDNFYAILAYILCKEGGDVVQTGCEHETAMRMHRDVFPSGGISRFRPSQLVA